MTLRTITIIIFGLFLLAFFYNSFLPRLEQIQALRDNVKRQKQNFLAVSERLEVTKRAVIKFKGLTAEERELVDSSLPEGEDLPNMLLLLDSTLRSAGLIVEDIKISGATSKSKEAVTEASALDEQLGDIAFDITALGGYESLKAFLRASEKTLRITEVESVTFAGASPLVKGVDNFRFSIRVKTYFYSTIQ